MKEIAVYTVIADNYEPLRKPLHRKLLKEADFYCFTNTSISSDYYNIVNVEKVDGSATLTNRYYKILSPAILENYKYTIYIDGAFKVVTESLRPLIEHVLAENDVALFKHRDRVCVYDEAKEIIRRRKANEKEVYRHVKRYSREGYPKNGGLIEAGVIVRNNQSSAMKKFVQEWWAEFYNNAHRDQLSFNYVLHKHPIKLAYIPGNIMNNDFFEYHIRPKTLPPKTLYEKFVGRYWVWRIAMLGNKAN